MNRFLRRIKQSQLFRQVGILLTGTAVAQVIPLLASPILTRIYEPAAFGAWTLYTSIVVTISSLAAFRYDLAIMLPTDSGKAEALTRASARIGLSTGLVVTAVALIFHRQITAVLQAPELSLWIYFAGANVALLSLSQTYGQWANRRQEYGAIASARILQAGSTPPAQLALSLLSRAGHGLILGSFIGHSLWASYLWKRTRQSRKKAHRNMRMRPLLSEHWRMPLLNGPHALADAVRLNGINVMISLFYGQVALGQYGLAWRTALIPASLINGALSRVYYQRLSVTPRGDMVRTVLKFAALSVSLAVLPFTVLYVLGEPLFALIFGSDWRMAGTMASTIAPWLLATFITAPLAYVFIVTGTQALALIWGVVSALVPLGVIWLHPDEIIAMLQVLVWAMVGLSVLFFIAILTVARRFDRGR